LETVLLGSSSNVRLLLSISDNFRFQMNTWRQTKHVCASVKNYSLATLDMRTTGWLFVLCPMADRIKLRVMQCDNFLDMHFEETRLCERVHSFMVI